jgi:hypothetical protein
MIYNTLNLVLLLGFCVFCSVLLFVINFVLGFAVQLASISTKLPSSVAYVGSQLISSKDGNFLHAFFHLHHLLGCALDVISFVLGLQSNFRPALRAWRCKVHTASFPTPSTSATTSQLQQLHGSFLGGAHLACLLV